MPAPPSKKRARLVLLTLFFGALVLVLFGGDYNVVSLWRLYKQNQALSEKVERLRVQNQMLVDQIKKLKEDPQAIEKVARENLGMAGKDETIYRILPEDGDSSLTDSLKPEK